MRVDVMSITVTSRLLARPASRVPRAVFCAARPRAVISVPAPSGFHEFRMRTGMFRSTAGRIVLGCSTFAPKYASSAASANESFGTRRGCRSEEHTSELQSLAYLVCRLLLEKKKYNQESDSTDGLDLSLFWKSS